MSNTHCPYCLEIYPEADSHECIGSLRERAKSVEMMLTLLKKIDEKECSFKTWNYICDAISFLEGE